MTGKVREAKCFCGRIVPSSEKLPFFESRDEGTRMATDTCKNCRYAEVAHRGETRNKKVCENFEPMGAWQYDTFYCGCRGWD